MTQFTHLHNHTHYSLLDGLSNPSKLAAQAKTMNMDSMAITDHGNMYGVIEFYKECKKQGIKPIIGSEFYVAENDRTNKSLKDNKTFHLILLAMNSVGYKNLCKLITEAYTTGFYYKPRIDFTLLEKYNEGIICLSGCLGGQISQALLADDGVRAMEVAQKYKKLFGDRYYIELQRHEHNEDQKKVTPKLIELAQLAAIEYVATADCHYIHKEDNNTHDVLLAIQTQTALDDKDRMTLKDDDFSLQSAKDMSAKFEDIPKAITNSTIIAERCNVDIDMGTTKLPAFEVPGGMGYDEYLTSLCFNSERMQEHYKERLEYELSVLQKTGFAPYMLIVADIVMWAKQQGIYIGPGRGSAAGSIVSYLLGITGIDPIEYGLYFERFMNPDRVSPPDIDIDIEDRRRDEVIKYIADKYGNDHVAQIATFGTMFARTSIRDVGRAMKYDLMTCDRISKTIPMNMSITEAIDKVDELQREYNNPENRILIDTAAKLEGCVRHMSTHACGVLISDKPVTEYMPMQKSNRSESMITQYGMNEVGDLGLLKMDFLGLRNLSVISDTIGMVKKSYGDDIDINNLPLDDINTFKLLQQGKTTSVFQLESPGMKKYLMDLKPTTIDDITVMISLYRPGPMDLIPSYVARKHGREKVEYLHPLLEPILKDTYGIMIYQEQLMAAVRALAGFTLSEADILRKAVGKKIKKLLDEQEGKFKDGCEKVGTPKIIADQFWALVEPFSRYGFNKSHAVSYAMISYQTAYLKVNYPIQFMVAELNSDSTIDRLKDMIQELASMGIQIKVPDINYSGYQFGTDGKSIRFALSSIKGIHAKILDGIVNERTNGLFESLQEFVTRCSKYKLIKSLLLVLAKSGALDGIHSNRNDIVENIEQITEYARQSDNMYMPPLSLPETNPATSSKRLSWERELLGFYISSNPALQYEEDIRRSGATSIANINDYNGRWVKVAGVISGIRKNVSKTGRTTYFITLQDTTGSTDVSFRATTYEKYIDMLKHDNMIVVNCVVNRWHDRQYLLASSL